MFGSYKTAAKDILLHLSEIKHIIGIMRLEIVKSAFIPKGQMETI